MNVENDHALNEDNITALAEFFDLLAQYDYNDHLKKGSNVNTNSLDPASKEFVLAGDQKNRG
ncbi:MAG: hypothetical protein A2431_00210 [Candidatus Zambryskibacteria bacterium RIFOXYC1_FULL_39_10]|uniref:Uncharacterized protein n=1 Tax=Candidatus Zambryskibacteria bacterium RIFOXYC1_FULL_39_10 TaxID=1802779 RepID=A0A1G2UZF8_9BACT|nr:MAG: hypothetical protein A2431_00210 [Candidatus Zambryskibacteria bacterium RIFOXYC1_FULL_39_10]OHB15971.1 MAG: hypothetical protein A2605_03750 [Candidatus Zambryskibacteria bacterium RIFOXYD1_FULL_39_35]